MDEKAVLEQVDTKILDFGSVIDAKLAEFGEKLPKEAIEPDEVKSAEEVAKLEAGVLEGLAKMEVWDIPLGQAVVGGFSSVIISELVDGFLAAQSNTIKGVVKLAAAGVAIKWGSRVLGKTGAVACGILLAYDGIRMLLPIDEWAGRVSGAVVTRTGGGLAGKAGLENVRGNGSKQPDYYEALKGGA